MSNKIAPLDNISSLDRALKTQAHKLKSMSYFTRDTRIGWLSLALCSPISIFTAPIFIPFYALMSLVPIVHADDPIDGFNYTKMAWCGTVSESQQKILDELSLSLLSLKASKFHKESTIHTTNQWIDCAIQSLMALGESAPAETFCPLLSASWKMNYVESTPTIIAELEYMRSKINEHSNDPKILAQVKKYNEITSASIPRMMRIASTVYASVEKALVGYMNRYLDRVHQALPLNAVLSLLGSNQQKTIPSSLPPPGRIPAPL